MQGEYCLSYGAVGTRVALIASEPITGQAGDWVAVPNNTALVVISEKVLSIGPCAGLNCTVKGPAGDWVAGSESTGVHDQSLPNSCRCSALWCKLSTM